jgi:hypothetical protein
MIRCASADHVERQLRFFASNRAGCLFAAAAATDPQRYGWTHLSVNAEAPEIDEAVSWAVQDAATTTLSLLLPKLRDEKQLIALTLELKKAAFIRLGMVEIDNDFLCLGFRAVVGDLASYVTGFGQFEFLPATRRAPFTELTTRVKPRPDYAYVFKPAPAGTIHLADLDMKGIAPAGMRRMWDGSFEQTARVLGAPADVRSAARTTFSIPANLYSINDYESFSQTGST